MIMFIGYNDHDDHRHCGGNSDGCGGYCDHQQANHDYRDHADLECLIMGDDRTSNCWKILANDIIMRY